MTNTNLNDLRFSFQHPRLLILVTLLLVIGQYLYGSQEVLSDQSDGLVAYYPLKINVSDISGNGHHAVNHNSSWGISEGRESILFNGSTSVYVSLPTSVVNNLTNYTISFYVKSVRLDHDNTIINGIVWHKNDFSLDFSKNGMSQWLENTRFSCGQSHSNDVWYHFAVVRDGKSMKFYENGVLECDTTCSTIPVHNITSLVLGHKQNGTSFEETSSLVGSLSELRVYNRALSSPEIRQIHCPDNWNSELDCSVCDDEGYFGEKCNFFCCFGVCTNNDTNSSHFCSGNGKCVSPNECQCDDRYSGNRCSKYYCFDYLPENQNVCSGRGICEKPDLCSCHNISFEGEKCEITNRCLNWNSPYHDYSSWYYQKYPPKNCHGEGECVLLDFTLLCKCNGNTYGDFCEYYSLWYKFLRDGGIGGVVGGGFTLCLCCIICAFPIVIVIVALIGKRIVQETKETELRELEEHRKAFYSEERKRALAHLN